MLSLIYLFFLSPSYCFVQQAFKIDQKKKKKLIKFFTLTEQGENKATFRSSRHLLQFYDRINNTEVKFPGYFYSNSLIIK